MPISAAEDCAAIHTPPDLLQHSPIPIRGFNDHWARYLSACELEVDAPAGRLITDTSTAAIEMVLAGLGYAIVLERFAQQAIRSGQKIRIVGAPKELGQAHYLVKTDQSDARQTPVMEFEAWLGRQF